MAIVGGGPAGAACAYWLALRGIDVTLIEKKDYPREKTCGDGLTPRSVVQLEAMGLGEFLKDFHRYNGLRAMAYGKSYELPWPSHPGFPTYGYVLTRADLDQAVALRASEAGVNLLTHTEATAAYSSPDGRIEKIDLKDKISGEHYEIAADYYVLAEGANSRLARSLGVTRDRSEPMGLAIRGYFESPRASEPWIESHLDLRSSSGDVMPGYGWIFPLGDGRVNVGFGLLTNSARWRSVNTTEAMAAFVKSAPKSWELSPATAFSEPTGGKLQMGHSVAPKSGVNHILIGDSAASINPFNGEGIAYAYETARLGAEVLTRAIESPTDADLSDYERTLGLHYGDYYRVARRFVKLIGDPRIMGPAMWIAMRDKRLMNITVRVMANLMRDEGPGMAEFAYQGVAKAMRLR